MRRTITLSVLTALTASLNAQDYQQYFDGADTLPYNSLFIHIDNSDSTHTNVWQIGRPQKTVFDAAATVPNAIVTDTINTYPSNDTSSFTFKVPNDGWAWGILAVQWKQKLDMDSGLDGGNIEFSADSGAQWFSAFDNPNVYNFYGFQPSNVDTLPSGQQGFTGTDSSWRDIWLCWDMSWLATVDTAWVRFTFTSDSTDQLKEGWLIDNILAHITWIHTVSEVKPQQYMWIYPNPTSGRVHIETQKINAFHIIESLEIFTAQGAEVRRYQRVPTKFFVDLDDLPPGSYFMRVTTNIQTETFKVVVEG
jgi:hypothetical protein